MKFDYRSMLQRYALHVMRIERGDDLLSMHHHSPFCAEETAEIRKLCRPDATSGTHEKVGGWFGSLRECLYGEAEASWKADGADHG
jgi:hypothetical protein